MYSSRPLDRRNADPSPYTELAGMVIYQPRPEFQYGKIPANPLLVEAREEWELSHSVDLRPTAEWAQAKLRHLAHYKGRYDTRTGKKVLHARRVFELLVALGKE